MRIGNWLRDCRYAWRSLSRNPGFMVVAVLALALGIGVVSATFNLVNVLLLKPVLIDDPAAVVSVFSQGTDRPDQYRAFSFPEYVAMRQQNEVFDDLAAHNIDVAGVGEGALTRRVMVASVSANYFRTLGILPAQGRSFTLAEERGNEPAVAVVSYDYWQRNGRAPSMVGSIVRVNGVQLTVVGIAAEGFTGTTALFAPEVWVPLAFMNQLRKTDDGVATRLQDARNRSLILFGRQRSGISAADLRDGLRSLATRVDSNLPAADGATFTYSSAPMPRLSVSTNPADESELFVPVMLLMALSAVVLLIACLDLANMFLARGAGRLREMAIRQSLGSGRYRLVRQLMMEGLLLAFLGGAAGLIWSVWGVGWIVASLTDIIPVQMRLIVDARPDLPVLLVTAAACIAATLIFGLGPSWRATGIDIVSGLKGSASGHAKGRKPFAGRHLLIVGQIGLSLVMLTTGGLFLRSALVAADATPGFDLDRNLLIEIDPGLIGYDETRSRALFARILGRLRSLPGIENASLASIVPFGSFTNMRAVQSAGRPPGEAVTAAHYYVVSDRYFDSLGLDLLRGRDFTAIEASAPTEAGRVAIIDEALARELFPDADPLGQRIQFGYRSPNGEPTSLEVIGIAPGTRHRFTDRSPSPHIYVPFGQAYASDMYVHLRVADTVAEPSSALATMRQEILGIDASLPLLTLTTLSDFRDDAPNLWLIRSGGQLFVLLGGLALFLALVGVYGVMAFMMSRRRYEIGVRMALGATRAAVLRQILRESMGLALAGLGVGLILALGVTRLLASFLYEISAMDPIVFAAATGFLALAALLAILLPVTRAVRVQPSLALRQD